MLRYHEIHSHYNRDNKSQKGYGSYNHGVNSESMDLKAQGYVFVTENVIILCISVSKMIACYMILGDDEAINEIGEIIAIELAEILLTKDNSTFIL